MTICWLLPCHCLIQVYIYIYIYIYIWHIHMCDIAIILVRRWYKVDHIHCHCLCGCLSSHQVRTLFKPWDRRLVSSKVENKKKSKLQQNPSRWHLTHPRTPGSWQTSLCLGSMSRYSAQILICITKSIWKLSAKWLLSFLSLKWVYCCVNMYRN